jgi:hypothetical protein
VGTQVEVAYLPEDPKQVRLLSDTAELNSDTSLEGRAARFFSLTVMSHPFPAVAQAPENPTSAEAPESRSTHGGHGRRRKAF